MDQVVVGLRNHHGLPLVQTCGGERDGWHEHGAALTTYYTT